MTSDRTPLFFAPVAITTLPTYGEAGAIGLAKGLGIGIATPQLRIAIGIKTLNESGGILIELA